MNAKSKLATSRVTNGSKFLPDVDGRSAIARRARDIFDAICLDLGGHDQLSEAQTQLVRRAAMISTAPNLFGKLARGSRDPSQPQRLRKPDHRAATSPALGTVTGRTEHFFTI